MSKLSLRKVKRNNLPYGKYTFIVHLNRIDKNIHRSVSNAGIVEAMRGFLDTTTLGLWRLEHTLNFKKKRVYTHLYLQNAMDVALIKLSYPDAIFKVFKVELEPSDE